MSIALTIAETLSFTAERWDNDARNWTDFDPLEMSRKLVLSSVLYRLHQQMHDPVYGSAKWADKARADVMAAQRQHQNNEISNNKMRATVNRAFANTTKHDILETMFNDFHAAYVAEFGDWIAPEIKEPIAQTARDGEDMADLNAKLAAMGLGPMTDNAANTNGVETTLDVA
jgi:hypothetical protein